MKQGPFSWRPPIRDDPPGPPLSQMASGAFWGSFLDSKNQKKLAAMVRCMFTLLESVSHKVLTC